MDTEIPGPSSQGRKQRCHDSPFTIHTNGFTPNKCCLRITYYLLSLRIQSNILRNLGGLICAPLHICTQVLSEEGRQGRNTVPQRSDNWHMCLCHCPERSLPFTSLGCPLLHCSDNTSIKSSLGFLTRPTSLPGADPGKHSAL